MTKIWSSDNRLITPVLARRTVVGILATGLLAMAGCGSSSPTARNASAQSPVTNGVLTAPQSQSVASSTSKKAKHLPEVALAVESASITGTTDSGGAIAARYTCDGANVTPEVRWSAVPAHTKELAVFILNSAYVHGQAVIDWAVAGVSPKLRVLSPGKLPKGAVVARNHLGANAYSICPAPGSKGEYAIVVIALPHRISATPKTDGAQLRSAALAAGSVEGLDFFTYKRA